jgi:hypothetical protein
MEPDPLREIRDIRRQISLACDNNPEKVFDYYVAHQEKMKATGEYKFVLARMAAESTDERDPE